MLTLLPQVILLLSLGAGHAQVSYDFGGAYAVVQRGTLRGSFRDAEMVMPIPLNQPMQTISDLQVTPADAQIYVDAGNRVAAAILKVAGSASAADMEIRYTVKCHPPKFDLEALAAREYPPYDSNSEIFRKYTSADSTVESDHPSITAIGDKLAADYPNPFLRARAAYHFVMQRCTYQVSRAPSALEMLASGVGNCTGYAKLFIAVARAAGIPARRCSGAVVGQEPPWHLWAEFYLPQVGWVSADPTNGDEAQDDPERYLGSLSAKPYVLLAQGRDLELTYGDTVRHFSDLSAGSARWAGNATTEFTFEATRMSPVRYAVLFQQSTRKRSVSVDLDEATLNQELAQAGQDGRRCIGIAVASRPTGLRYGAVWEHDSNGGDWAAYPRGTSGTIAQLLRSERDQHRMPISLASCASETGEETYAAVFAPDKGTTWTAHIGVPKEQFMDHVRTEMQSRRIPGAISAHLRNGNAVVSGVFAELRGSASITTGMWLQPAAFDARLQQYMADGSFPISIGATDEQPPYFHVVAMRTGTPIAWSVQRDLWAEQVRDSVAQAAQAGLQPVAIVAY